MKSATYILICFLLLVPLSLFAKADPVEAEYQKAAECYHLVGTFPEAEQSRAKWFKCIAQFDAIAKKYPKTKRAVDSLFSAGLSYRSIYKITQNEEDALDAVDKLNELAKRYPKSNLADDALLNVGRLQADVLRDKDAAQKTFSKIVRWYPDGDMAGEAESFLGNLGSEKESWIQRPKKHAKTVRLTEIVREKGEKSEKVSLKMKERVEYSADNKPHKDGRFALFTLDLDNTLLSKTLDIGDYSYTGKGIIRDITATQEEKGKAKLSLVIKKGNHCDVKRSKEGLDVVCLSGPAKPVIDLENQPAKAAVGVGVRPTTETVEVGTEEVAEDPAEKGKRLVVVIDAGHGGSDTGAIGPSGTREKDIALQLAKRLGWQLRNKLNMDVNYTRIDDRIISLDDRNDIASGYNADLFISIHANAAENKELTGYQTFYLNNASDKASRGLAARENASLGKKMDDIEKIILTMMQNVNTDESRLLGKAIHKKVLSGMSRYGLKDRGLKSALFYVLVGAKCPAVLIETSFISNAEEEKRLNNHEYQETIVRSITDGIRDYLQKTKILTPSS